MNNKERAAIQQALEALEVYGEHAKDCPQYPTYTRPQDYPKCDCGYEEAITALREALAEQVEQEPVGRWNWNEAKFEWLTKFDYHKHHMTPLYAAPLAKQDTHATHVVRTKDLSDDEIADALYGKGRWRLGVHPDHLREYRRVIAAYKEKNK